MRLPPRGLTFPVPALVVGGLLLAGCPTEKDDQCGDALNPCETDPDLDTTDTGESDTGDDSGVDSGVDSGETDDSDDTHSDTGPDDSGSDTDTDTDTDTGDSGTETDDTSDTSVEYFDADDLLATHLAITEFMLTPGTNCGVVPSGQYIELLSDADVDWYLVDLQLVLGTQVYTFNEPTRLIGAKERFVVYPDESSGTSCHSPLNSGIQNGSYPATPATPWGPKRPQTPRTIQDTVTPSNSEVITIRSVNAVTVFDTVDYRNFELWNTNQSPMEHTPAGYSAVVIENQGAGTLLKTHNDDEANWCLGGTQMGGSQDFGNPFAGISAASGCGVPPDPPDTDPSDCVDLADIGAGELVITEVMFDNPGVCTNGTAGQWIEIANIGNDCINLRGMQFDWGTAPATVNRPATKVSSTDWDLDPGEYALVRRRVSGVTCPASFPNTLPAQQAARAADRFRVELELGPANQALRLETSAGQLIDAVDFRVGFPGVSIDQSLSYGPTPSTSGNDDGDDWCASTAFLSGMGGSFFGTPGAINPECPEDTGDTGETDDTGEPPLSCFERPRNTSDGLDATELCPGELMITEIMLNPQKCPLKAFCQYVELYNATSYDVDPTGLFLRNNSTTSLYDLEWVGTNAPDSIPPGGYYVVQIQSSSVLDYVYDPAADPYPPELFTTAGLGQTVPQFATGSFRLESAQELIDRVNTTGWAIAATQRLSMQLRDVPNIESDNDLESAWCSADATTQLIPLTPIASGSPVDAGTPYEANLCVGDTDDTDGLEFARNTADGLDAEELLAGELVITEAMFQPLDCVGPSARYVEVYNASPYVIRPAGLKVQVGSTVGTVEVEMAPGEIRPNRYGVLGLSTDDPFCYDADRGYQVRGVSQLNASAVTLATSFHTIDAVNFGAFRIPTGASLQIDPTVTPDSVANDDEDAWCPAGVRAPGVGTQDRATPGYGSQVCGSYDPSTGGVDSGGAALTADDLQPNDLVVAELMLNPDCPEARAEYVEIHNRLEQKIDLGGVELVINASVPFVFPDGLEVPALGELVFVRDPGTATRCIVPKESADGVYRQDMGFKSGGSRSVVVQVRRSGVPFEIDRVSTDALIGGAVGRSTQLDVDRTVAGQNDQAAYWCPTLPLSPYDLSPDDPTTADFGSPGRGNISCGDTTDTDPFDTDTDGIDTQVGDTDDTFPDDVFEPVTVLQPGDLVITEVMATPAACTPQSTAEYIEVYNTRSDQVNLQGLEILDKNNYLARVETRVLIAPGGYAVLANVADGFTKRCYLDPAAKRVGGYVGGAALNDAGDTIVLTKPDGTTITSFDYDDLPRVFGRSYSLGRLTAPTDPGAGDVANWCVSKTTIPGVSDRGTPGTANTCDPSDPRGLDTTVRAVDELAQGDLVINEVLFESNVPGCSVYDSQYVEVRNVSGETVDLYGMRMTNRLGEQAAVTLLEHVLVGPGELVTGRRWASPSCYPLAVDFQYPGVTYARAGDVVRLVADGGDVDLLDTRSWPAAPKGTALTLSFGVVSATANDDLANWCPSSDAISLSGGLDRGSPAQENDQCPTGSGDTDDTGSPDTDDEPDSGIPDDTDAVDSGDPVLALSALSAGDLRIDELLIDPLDCADARAEYLEIRNLAAQAVNLDGLVITTSSGTATVSGTVLVPAGARALGVRLDSSPQCHDLPADFSYVGAGLPNAGPAIVTIAFGGTTFDTFDYASLGSIVPGRAASRDTTGAWCSALDPIPGGVLDAGTPGYANPSCSGSGDTDGFQDTFDTFQVDTSVDVDPVSTAEVGELLITEFLVDPRDCEDARGEYIEVYNNTDRGFDLDGLIVGSGVSRYEFDREPGRLLIHPGQYMVLRRSGTVNCYSYTADATYTGVPLGNPPGRIFLANATTVIDLVDFSSFNVEGGRALTLDPDVLGPAPIGGTADAPDALVYPGTYQNNDEAKWCLAFERIPGASADKGSPGVPNAACLGDTDDIPYPPDYVADLEEVEAGDLVITELMIDPQECGDLFGEYIEILNRFPTTVDLRGLVIRTSTGQTTIDTETLVASGDRVIGRKVLTQAQNPGTNRPFSCYVGQTPDFLFPGVTFANRGDSVRIENSHATLDVVDFTTWGGAYPGRSMQLRADAEDVVSNDAQSAWCWSDETFVGAAEDFGSPRRASVSCATLPAIRRLANVTVGELVISELLPTPASCPTGATYFGIHNTSADTIQLEGLEFDSLAGKRFIRTSTLVWPGDEVVVAYDASECIDFPEPPDVSLSFSDGAWDISPTDVVRLLRSGTTIDKVDMGGWNTPAAGRALQLRPGFETPTDNDVEVNWCQSDLYFDSIGHRGTPGAPNDCGTDPDGPPPPDSDVDEVETADTAPFYFAEVQGFVDFVPNASLEGAMDRIALKRLRPQQPFGPTHLAAPDDPDRGRCFYNWTVVAIKNVLSADICPTCQFGFTVEASGRSDQMSLAGFGTSSCPDEFAAAGGVSSRFVVGDLFYSPTYGIMMERVNGRMEPYAYDLIDYSTIGNYGLEWKRLLFYDSYAGTP